MWGTAASRRPRLHGKPSPKAADVAPGTGRAMVTVITDKLRNQTLEDVESAPVPIPQSAGTPWSFSGGGHEAKGEAEGAFPGWPMGGAERPPLDAITFSKVHFVTETLGSTPPAPPTKRHCRSRSIPGDSDAGEPPWQPQASSVWRPVAVKSHLSRRRSPLSGRVRHCSSPSGPPLRPLPRAEHSTPPVSPLPRPSSAAGSRVDFAPLPYTEGAYRSRSMSMEDAGLRRRRISAPSLRHPPPTSLTRDTQLRVPGAGSMPSIVGADATDGPASPRMARCRSQPCVLQERKCLKRRREERPTLDLYKMQETCGVPYVRQGLFHGRRYSSDQNLPYSRLLAPELVVGLNTIASSPLDSNLPGSLTYLGPLVPVSKSSTAEDPDCGMMLPPDSMGFMDQEASQECACAGDTEDRPVFDLEINSDLDLDEIEKD